jgi:hypothetical protein
MDLSTPFASVPPVSFGAILRTQEQKSLDATIAPDAREGRRGFISRINKRRFGCLQRAAEAVEMMPESGEACHIIMSGFFDLMHAVIAIINRIGLPVEMRFATLSLSRRNVAEMASLLDLGKVTRLDFLVSHFFSKHDTDIFNELVEQFHARGQRVAVARSHCKIVTLRVPDGRYYILEGSPNARTNRNAENLTIINDRDVFQFYDSWLDSVVSKYAV